jgi:hypothetical protein
LKKPRILDNSPAGASVTLVHTKLSTQENLDKIAENGQKKSRNNYSGYEQNARTSREKRKLTGAKLYNVSYR